MGWGVGGEDGNNVATPGFRQAQGCYWSFNFRWISETPVTSSLKVVTGLACDRHAALFWLSSPLPVCISVILHSITLDPLTPLSYLNVFYILFVSCLSYDFLLDHCFHLFLCSPGLFIFGSPFPEMTDKPKEEPMTNFRSVNWACNYQTRVQFCVS